jgi:hypothetical protein
VRTPSLSDVFVAVVGDDAAQPVGNA